MATPGNPLRYNTHQSAPPVSSLANSRRPGKRSQSPLDMLEHRDTYGQAQVCSKGHQGSIKSFFFFLLLGLSRVNPNYNFKKSDWAGSIRKSISRNQIEPAQSNWLLQTLNVVNFSSIRTRGLRYPANIPSIAEFAHNSDWACREGWKRQEQREFEPHVEAHLPWRSSLLQAQANKCQICGSINVKYARIWACCCCLFINSTQPPNLECIQSMKGIAQAT